MSPIQRMLREKVYYYRRKYQLKNKKNIGFRTITRGQIPIDFKKLIGLSLLVIGILLLLSKCFFGGKEEEKKEASQGGAKTYVAEVIPSATTSFEEYFQDFNIAPKELTKVLRIAIKQKQSYAYTLAVYTSEKFKGTSSKKSFKILKNTHKMSITEKNFIKANALYEQFIYDIKYFPVANKEIYSYENSWKQKRTFKGERQHYGIDIMDTKNISGKVKIVSMTTGTIENVGWNEMGGYRVGIRSEGGAYFYYAHLHDIPKHLIKGKKIRAGEYIGLMGNTGYGPLGTRGKFPVHLHIGIALTTKENKELWINPYPILHYIEKNKVDVFR